MGKYSLKADGRSFEVDVKKLNAEYAVVNVNGKDITVSIQGGRPVTAKAQEVKKAGVTHAPEMVSGETPAGGAVKAPISGAVTELLVNEGDTVERGQGLVKIEAMKMENEIKAPASGTVQSVKVSVGTAVSQGQVLLSVE